MCYMTLTSNQCSCGVNTHPLRSSDICATAMVSMKIQYTHTHSRVLFEMATVEAAVCVLFSKRVEQVQSPVNISAVCCSSRWAGSSRGRRAGPWPHSRRAGNLWTAAAMTTKVRSGGATGPPPSPRPSQPAGPSRSAARRAAYTEAHQSTHTRPSGQDTHIHRGVKYK